MENTPLTPSSMGGSSSSSRSKAMRVVAVIVVICILIAVGYLVWAKFYNTPVTPSPQAVVSPSAQPSTLGGQIYDQSQSQNVIDGSLPQTNPFQ